MKRAIIFLTGLICITCQKNIPEKSIFADFQNSILKFNNHYMIGDTISSTDDLWAIKDFIDTTYILKYNLIDTTFKTESYNKIKVLKDYHCSFIGQFKINNRILLITYSIRGGAGDGNPILTATTFSEKGKLLDLLRIDLETIRDPFYQPINYISISKDFNIVSMLIEKKFDEYDDKFVLIDSTATVKKYYIDTNGQFKEKYLSQ